MSFVTTSCFEDYDDRQFFTTLTVEFNDAVTRGFAAGVEYPLLPALRNNAGLRQFRVNLFGGLHDQDLIIPVTILTGTTTGLSNPMPDAVEGVHFNLPNGLNVRIPAGEAFGTLDVDIPTLTNTTAVRLVFELQPNDVVNASNNHKRIGMNILR